MKTLTDKIDFAEYLKFIGRQESQYIVQASSLTQKVLERFRGEDGTYGLPLPWSKTHHCIRLRPGEVSIWGAYNGHGKSQMLNQICAWNLNRSRWLIASMEMNPVATMVRMNRQVSGVEHPTDEFQKNFMEWTDNRLWIYDQTDTVQWDRILGMAHYAVRELFIEHIIIDSLMKCGFRGGKDKVSMEQVEFVNRLCWLARGQGVHIHLVHHMRKGEGNSSEHRRPGKHDFRGAGELVDLVDNAFVIHRNKKKEEKIQQGKDVDEDEPDGTLSVVKQRHGEWEGTFRLWFHKESMQYTPTPENRAIPYELYDDELEARLERQAIQQEGAHESAF